MDAIVLLLVAGDPRVPSLAERPLTGNPLTKELQVSCCISLFVPRARFVLNIDEREKGKRNRKEKLGRVGSRPCHLPDNCYR